MIRKRYTSTEVAEMLGVVPKTLYRWEKEGKVPKVRRDWKGWRVYTPRDVKRFLNMIRRLYK